MGKQLHAVPLSRTWLRALAGASNNSQLHCANASYTRRSAHQFAHIHFTKLLCAQERETLAAQERQEREARRVRARPLPLSTDMVVVPPRPAPRGLTLPQPFHLQSEARHEGYLTRRQQELQQQELTRKQEADFKVCVCCFRLFSLCLLLCELGLLQRGTGNVRKVDSSRTQGQPCHAASPSAPTYMPLLPRHTARRQAQPMWDGRPFVVHDSEASLTVPVDPHLATESRAPEREVFDRKVQDKNAAAEVRCWESKTNKSDFTVKNPVAQDCLLAMRVWVGVCAWMVVALEGGGRLLLWGAALIGGCGRVSAALAAAITAPHTPSTPLPALTHSQAEAHRQGELKRQREEQEEKEYRKTLKFKVGSALAHTTAVTGTMACAEHVCFAYSHPTSHPATGGAAPCLCALL